MFETEPHCRENLLVFSVLLYGTELYVLYPMKCPIAGQNKQSIFQVFDDVLFPPTRGQEFETHIYVLFFS